MNKSTRLKRFFRRVNRGLVLGLVFGILIVVFVTVDTMKFKEDTKEIQADIVSYITDIANLNGMFQSTQVGRYIDPGDRNILMAELENILDKYYADPEIAKMITVYDGYDKNEILPWLNEWFDKTAGFKLMSASIDDESDDFSIAFQKQGSGFALVQLNDLPITIEIEENYRNTVDIFLGAGPSYLIDPRGGAYDFVSPIVRERTIYISGSVYVALVDDEWKILMSEFYTKIKPELK